MNTYFIRFILYSFSLIAFVTIKAQSVELHLKKVLEVYRLPAISLAYIDEEGAWQHTTLGFRNSDSLTRVNDETYFSAASLSKPVVAYITFLLAQEGLIDTSKPLANYFEYEDLFNKKGYDQVTFEMILSHQSGLPNWRNMHPLDFDFPPGTTFHYSGEGYLWLQKR